MKNSKKFLFLALALSFSNALDFGNMGGTSMSLGGSGVALENSAFSSYYNPSLVSTDNKIRLGYTGGVRIDRKNIDKLNPTNTNTSNPSLKDILSQNYSNLTSQNGISFQFSPAWIRGSFGSLAFSYFASFYSNISASSKISKSDTQEVGSLISSNLLLQEIPISYAYTFFFKNSNLNIGANFKYMNAIFYQEQNSINANTNIQQTIKNIRTHLSSNNVSNFGLDLGISYNIDLPKFQYLTFGAVAKNINYPSFKFDGTKIIIKPQYRVGIAYNHPLVTFSVDADILPNEIFTFSDSKQFSQMIGAGLKFDLKVVDMRIGAAKDLRQDNGMILTTGINVLGFLDIAFQIGTKATSNSYTPRYMALQVGGSFSF